MAYRGKWHTLLRHRHGFLYFSSSIKYQQCTTFCKVCVILGIFWRILHVYEWGLKQCTFWIPLNKCNPRMKTKSFVAEQFPFNHISRKLNVTIYEMHNSLICYIWIWLHAQISRSSPKSLVCLLLSNIHLYMFRRWSVPNAQKHWFVTFWQGML